MATFAFRGRRESSLIRIGRRSLWIACVLILLLAGVFFSAMAHADKLKNSDFLKSTEAQRHWWYSGAYTALGHIAFLEDEEKGKCVWNWLFGDYEKKEALLMESFQKYPDHTPTSIVIALLRRDCGVFLETGNAN